MSSQSLVYSSLMEEEKNTTGWHKATIDYVLHNKTKVNTSIRGIGKSLNKILQKTDVEDIYQEILNYLYTCDDYNISKAYERSNTIGNVVSLEGYVHSCIKFCVIRYVTTGFNIEKSLIRDQIKDDDGKELSIFDTIADSKGTDAYSEIQYDLKDVCEAYESHRYLYGPDIFQLWYIRLQTMIYNKQDRFKDILTVLGISKKEMAQMERLNTHEGAMASIAKAITLVGIEKAAEIIKDYTYSADRVEKVIKLF